MQFITAEPIHRLLDYPFLVATQIIQLRSNFHET